MAQQLIITAVGPDRPGLVDQISGYLLDAGGNIADSRMINMCGQFALIMLARVQEAEARAIEAQLEQDSAALGLAISVIKFPNTEQAEDISTTEAVAFHLRVFGMDKPGIVHQITHLLHQHQVNIEEMQTHLESSSYSDTPQFTMELAMTIPVEVQISQLREELAAKCDSLNCDLDLEPG